MTAQRGSRVIVPHSFTSALQRVRW